jgi:hypothetical protein
MSNLLKTIVLTEEQINQIKAIDAKVKADVDALPNDNTKFSKIKKITETAIAEKNVIKSNY